MDTKRPLFLIIKIGYNSVKLFSLINKKGMIARWQDQGNGKVCKMPELNTFGPYANKGSEINIDDTVEMTVEEFETIRMIDLEGRPRAVRERMQMCKIHSPALIRNSQERSLQTAW